MYLSGFCCGLFRVFVQMLALTALHNRSRISAFLIFLTVCLLFCALEKGACPENSHVLYCHIKLAFSFELLRIWITFFSIIFFLAKMMMMMMNLMSHNHKLYLDGLRWLTDCFTNFQLCTVLWLIVSPQKRQKKKKTKKDKKKRKKTATTTKKTEKKRRQQPKTPPPPPTTATTTKDTILCALIIQKC